MNERVLERNQKILDYWDHTEKFILEGKMLKKVKEGSSKHLKKKILMLKKIIEKFLFKEIRTF